MHLIAEYGLTFKRHADNGKRIIPVTAIAGSYDPLSIPESCRKIFLAWTGNSWSRNTQFEANPPKMQFEASDAKEWEKGTVFTTPAEKDLICGLLSAAVQHLFPGSRFQVKTPALDWKPMVQLMAHSAFPLTGDIAAATLAAKSMQIKTNLQLKSWF